MVKPRTFVAVGMAGVGKTTFCHRLYTWLSRSRPLENGLSADVTSINLDPAVRNPKMPLDIDIRDNVDFHETMKKYNLGPNGAANTCLNLFMLQFSKPERETKYTLIDTPGQIEALIWSSPGEILFRLNPESCILYVIDVVSCMNKRVFMNNMIFAAAMRLKFRCPVVLVFNKSDMADIGPIRSWITSFEIFKEGLTENEADLGSSVLYFEEFYRQLNFVCVSALTGAGKKDFFSCLSKVFSGEDECWMELINGANERQKSQSYDSQLTR